MIEIAKCESNFKTNAKNPISSASGLFQITDKTFKWVWEKIYNTPVDFSLKNDVDIQIEMATWLYVNYGLSHWECGTLKNP